MQNLQVYSSYNNYEYHTKITILVKNQHFLLDSQDQKGIKHKKHRYFIYPRLYITHRTEVHLLLSLKLLEMQFN